MSNTRFTRRHALLAGAVGLAAAPLFVASQALAEPGTDANAATKLYIDPGHGGSDSGAVGNGLAEKELTLDISLKLRDILAANSGIEIRMSRDSDITRSLDYRSSDANSWGAALFVSVHINAGGGTGFESYRYTNALPESVRLQDNMHPAILAGMNSAGSVADRGPKAANFHVLRETSMPAILTENLFIDTAADAALLGDDAFLAATAKGHADGILAYLGL